MVCFVAVDGFSHQPNAGGHDHVHFLQDDDHFACFLRPFPSFLCTAKAGRKGKRTEGYTKDQDERGNEIVAPGSSGADLTVKMIGLSVIKKPTDGAKEDTDWLRVGCGLTVDS